MSDGPRRIDRCRPVPAPWIVPEWSLPGVRAMITTRHGGVSQGPWSGPSGGGMNVGTGTGDNPENVAVNRSLLERWLPSRPRWLSLQHASGVVDAESVGVAASDADSATALCRNVVCCVTVADCLPVLLADRRGRVVGAAHAGWRGLAAGVIQATVHSMRRRLGQPAVEIVAFLGPCIGPSAFEVELDVLQAMRRGLPDAEACFEALGRGKWKANLAGLARQALAQVDVAEVLGGHWCTFADPDNFYSFRRDRVTGRHAALIWLETV
jgi:polyphenol oxidase